MHHHQSSSSYYYYLIHHHGEFSRGALALLTTSLNLNKPVAEHIEQAIDGLHGTNFFNG